VHRKTGQIMRILDRGTSSIQVRLHCCCTMSPNRPTMVARSSAAATVLQQRTC
jgi:hypothetical protein